MTIATFQQVTHRIRDDDGDETGATWLAGQGDDYSMDVDTNFRVRFRVDETTGAKDWSNNAFNLYYSLNSGTYAAIDNTTPVQYATTGTGNYTDGDDCTSQLTGGTGTFVTDNNGMSSGDAQIVNSGTAGQLFECEFCLTIDSAQVANGNTIDLRVYNGTSAFGSGYSDTPRLTVVEIDTRTVNVNDGVGVSDTGSASVSSPQIDIDDAVTAADVPVVSFVVETLEANVNDGVGVGETSAASVSDPQVNVTDSVTSSDTPAASVSSPQASTSDPVAVADTPTVNLQGLETHEANVNDGVTVGDAPAVSISDLQASASETVTAGESVGAGVSSPQVDVNDAVTAGDTPSLSVGGAGDLTLSVSDSVTLADTVTLAFEAMAISAQDGVTLAEAVTLAAANLGLSVSESVMALDDPTVMFLSISGDISEERMYAINSEDRIYAVD